MYKYRNLTIGLLLGAAVGWVLRHITCTRDTVSRGWLLRRRVVRESKPPPCECWAGTGFEDWEDDEPTTMYEQAIDGYMHISWMQSDGTWTWAGL